MLISSPTPDYSLPTIISRASLEQVIINETVVNGQFRQNLIDNPVSTLNGFLPAPLPSGMDVRVYVEDAHTFYYVTPNTTPDQNTYTLESAAVPVAMSLRAGFVVQLNFLLSPPDDLPADDLPTALANMQAADLAENEATIAAQNAEVAAAQAGQDLQAAQLAYARALAAAELVPDDAGLQDVVANAQAAVQSQQQIYQTAAATASDLRNTANLTASAALDADGRYEDALRVTFQQQFAADPVAALNTFLNLITPFTSYNTIRDTDPLVNSTPNSEGMCFTHLIETTGDVLFLVLPYTANHALFMGPYSISFNGTSSYIQVPTSPSLTPHTFLMVEAWVWVDTFRQDSADVVLSTLTGGGGWQLEVGGGIPKFTATLGGVSQSITSNISTPLATAKWHYLVAALRENQLSVYVNGIQCGTTPVSGDLTVGGNLLMGRNAAMQADGSFFMGMLHEVRLWGDALTQLAVIATQNSTLLPTPLQEALLAHYVFNEGVNFNALDDSPNHNDGVMMNAIWKITGQNSPA